MTALAQQLATCRRGLLVVVDPDLPWRATLALAGVEQVRRVRGSRILVIDRRPMEAVWQQRAERTPGWPADFVFVTPELLARHSPAWPAETVVLYADGDRYNRVSRAGEEIRRIAGEVAAFLAAVPLSRIRAERLREQRDRERVAGTPWEGRYLRSRAVPLMRLCGQRVDPRTGIPEPRWPDVALVLMQVGAASWTTLMEEGVGQ